MEGVDIEDQLGGALMQRHALCSNRDAIIRMLAEAGCESPRLFGSVVRGDAGSGSDIDILVSVAKPLGFLRQAKLEHSLSRLLGVKVDLVLERSLRPDFANQILMEAVPL